MTIDTLQPRGVLRRIADRPAALAALYLLLAVVLAALGWSGLWSVFSLLPDRVSPWWTLVTASAACSLLPLRPRAPGVATLAAAVVFVADLLTVGGLVPLLVLLDLFDAHIVRLGPEQRRRLLVVLVPSALAPLVVAFALSGDLREAVMVGIQFGALVGMAYWYANFKAQSREMVELYRQRAEDAALLAELDRASAVRSERERMARELHDVVAGHVSAVAIRSEAALGLPSDTGDAEAARGALRAVRDASLEAHGALRSMIRVLRTGEQDLAPPGRADLADLVDAANGAGVTATLSDESAAELPTPVDQAIGSVVREALANCVRHAAGAEVEVRVTAAHDEARVDVVSRGGAALARPSLEGSGMGIALLRERVLALEGELSAGPEGEGVWAVRARLPVPVRPSEGILHERN